jgi:hypothetical protein
MTFSYARSACETTLIDGESKTKRSSTSESSDSRLYYKPLGESAENLELMEIMDRLCLADPTLDAG